MSRDNDLPETDVTSKMNFDDTELTLGIPGEGRSRADTGGKSFTGSAKRGFIETVTVDLNIGSSSSCSHLPPIGIKHVKDYSESQISSTGKYPASKAQVVGWPPVRSFRKKSLEGSSKLVKVAVDGAPYLRKVDLDKYGSYEQLLKALEEMFTCLTIHGNYMEEDKLMGPVKGTEYVPTYEDKDGDWMLVGDVPWNMFVESCKRIRLMKSSEAMGLAVRTPTNGSSSS